MARDHWLGSLTRLALFISRPDRSSSLSFPSSPCWSIRYTSGESQLRDPRRAKASEAARKWARARRSVDNHLPEHTDQELTNLVLRFTVSFHQTSTNTTTQTRWYVQFSARSQTLHDAIANATYPPFAAPSAPLQDFLTQPFAPNPASPRTTQSATADAGSVSDSATLVSPSDHHYSAGGGTASAEGLIPTPAIRNGDRKFLSEIRAVVSASNTSATGIERSYMRLRV